MKNSTTEMVFILDRSGSMAGFVSDTIGGFNSMIAEQKKKDGKAYVTTVIFDDKSETIHDRIAIEKVKPLTEKEYFARGTTALLDSIGETVNHIGNIHKYARKEDVPENTMVVIITDGMENASHKYSGADIKKIIERQKEKYGWEFMFIGANMDAVTEAENIGIAPERAVNYRQDSKGTKGVYAAVSRTACCMREAGRIDDDWNKEINEYFENSK